MPPNNADNLAAAASRTTRRARGGRLFLAPLYWAAAFVVIVFGISMEGCAEPKAEWRGQQMTGAQVEAAIEAETAALARKAAAREAAFKLAVSKADAFHQIDLMELAAKYEADRAELDDALAAIGRDKARHAADIESQWSAREGWGELLQTVGGAVETFVPGAGPVLAPFGGGAAVGGLVGGLFGLSRSKRFKEALRAVAGGIASLPAPMREAAKDAIGLQADEGDRAVIGKIVRNDNLLAVEKKVDAKAA